MAALMCCSGSLFSQNFWQKTSEEALKAKSARTTRLVEPTAFKAFTLDTVSMKAYLAKAPKEFTAAARNKFILSIPMPDGTVSNFAIAQTTVMEAGLAAKYPEIKVYNGQGIEDPAATIKIDWTYNGFHAMIFSPARGIMSVSPYTAGSKTEYVAYHKKDLPKAPFTEVGVEEAQQRAGDAARTAAGSCIGTQLRTYRLAVACTGEYARALGYGAAVTDAQTLSAIVTTINRVNGVYEKEAAIRLVLIANESAVVFTDPTTDPFNGNNSAPTLINESQNVITNYIGSANFDIGHTFSTGGGGLAGLGVVCISSQKARGITGSPQPYGDGYDIDYVAHEMGHQFGAPHTFNATTGNCGNNNRSASTAVEPGSGVTIMGYAGICTSTNDLAANSIPYFHSISLGNIAAYSQTSSGNACASITSTGNGIPVVNAGSNYTIPVSTPFTLTGSATDPDGDALTYSWEEFDLGPAGDWSVPSGTAPIFRSFAPSASPVRTFPQWSDILNGTTTIGEVLPSYARTLNMRLTARDNKAGGGGVCSADMVVTVSGTTPFKVTSQATTTTWTANGSNTATITWDVAGTNAAPFNTSAVDILFSTDGGFTYPYTLVANTSNDGSETIVIPAYNTANGRIMIKARGNVFFSINAANISIASTCGAEGAIVAPAVSVSAPAGSSALNLNLSPQYATPFTASGNITTTDPSTNLVVASATNSCAQYTNIYNYDLYTFNVSVSGAYTINRTGSGSVFNIYSSSFNPASLCTNWIASNFITGTGTYASITVNLTAGVTYILIQGVYGNDATTPSATLPFSYSFTITPPAGGAVYAGSSPYGNPGTGFSYQYVIVNNATGNIVGISATPNLTNSTTYPVGTYTVYGISYNQSIATALNAYVGQSFTALTNQIANNPSTFCANLSKNSVYVQVSGSVPVTLVDFRARKSGADKALLEWSTATEINSDYFVVERSANGTDFSTVIGKTGAAGNSTSLKAYNLTDNQPLAKWNYYRLKQVDKDGSMKYSQVVALNFEAASSLMVVYPNPAHTSLTLEYNAGRAGKLALQVTDSRGAIVKVESINVNTGRNVANLNITNLVPGVYILRSIAADGNTIFTKFIKE